MATTTTTTTSISTKTSSAQLKVQLQPIKPKRRKCKETTISSSASTAAATTATTNNYSESGFPGVLSRKLDPPTIVSPDSSWCCPASKPLPSPPRHLPLLLLLRRKPAVFQTRV